MTTETLLLKPEHSPAHSPAWNPFYEFVTTNLGDIPVLDGCKFISQKMQGYWKLWNLVQYIKNHDGQLCPEMFWFFLEYYLEEDMVNLPRTVVDHHRINRYLNLWKLLGGDDGENLERRSQGKIEDNQLCNGATGEMSSASGPQ